MARGTSVDKVELKGSEHTASGKRAMTRKKHFVEAHELIDLKLILS